jgi:hypothetical protein
MEFEGAFPPRHPTDDPDLAAVIAAWDRLPAAIKAALVARIQAAIRPTPKLDVAHIATPL